MASFDWGSVIGGAIGAVVTGGAQIASFYMGRKSGRDEMTRRAASELLEVLYECDRSLPTLFVTGHSPGSSLYSSERLKIAQPMLDSLKRAEFTLIPQISDSQLRERFCKFSQLCNKVSGAEIDAHDLGPAVLQVREYGAYVRTCLDAKIRNARLPSPAKVPVIGA